MVRLAASAVLVLSLHAQVHPTPMAGRWFPAEPVQLDTLLDQAYAQARLRSGVESPRKGLLALVVPHAGLQYSGVPAASAYRLIGQPRNIILLGFSHRFPLEGVAYPKLDSFTLPGGELKVHRELAESLGFRMVEEKALCDHSLENQLPFLRRAAPKAGIIPLYVGALAPDQLNDAARRLANRVRQGDLVIASSDFTHYGEGYHHTPFPNDGQLPARLRDRANEAFENIGSLSVHAFDQFLTQTEDTICGRDPIRLLMATLAQLKDDIYMTQADYLTSGQLTGDHSASVTYGALAFYPMSSFTVGPEDQRLLLTQSRSALESHYSSQRHFAMSVQSRDLMQRTGAFVTIRKKGELRGCIGNLSPRTALTETIADRTIAAARSDPRFPPLARDEGPVALEVSLLTPLKRLHDWRSYRDGWGAVLVMGKRGGLLLPQVAQEMRWNREQFLDGLSQKAGLPPKSYQNPKARLYVFHAQVFGEE